MRAIRFHEKGAADVLQLEDVPIPEKEAGDLLVRIEAAGISYGDVLRRRGGHYPLPTLLPCIPGEAVAGIVEDVGDGVDRHWLGRRVYGRVRSGGYAEYGTGHYENFVILPDGISSVDAVAVLSDGVAAAIILKWRGQLRPGQSVFIPAAAGGLGHIAVQLARLYGASKVYGGASTEAKRQIVLDAGADAAFDYTQSGWAEKVIAANGGIGVDLALEMTGGPVFYETLDVVRPGGRIVNYGNASDTDSPVNPRQLLRKNLTLTGFLIHGPFDTEKHDVMKDLIGFLENGSINAHATSYPLGHAAEAHRAIEARSSVGRQILVPGN